MTRYTWMLAVVTLALLAFVSSRDVALGDNPPNDWRQEDPKFGVTQKYCRYTSNSMIRSAAAKAFNAIDGHFGGAINPVQFADSCNLDWSYLVDENSGDCGTDELGRPYPGCALIWNYYWDGEHFHGNGGHIGIDTSFWIWDSQGAMDFAVGHELLHLWGLTHVDCPHSHPTAMAVPAEGTFDHIEGNCTGATGVTSEDLAALDPLYSSDGTPLFAHLEADEGSSYGTFYWYAADIHEEAWFLIDRSENGGAWFNETMWAAKDSDSISDPDISPLPERQPGATTRQDCWRIKAWANWWASDYGAVSCISRPGTTYPRDGTLTEFMGFGTSEIIGQNLTSDYVVMKLYDGLLGLGGVTWLRTCNSVAPGGQCSYSYDGRGRGGWISIEVSRPDEGAWAWAVAVAELDQEPPPTPPQLPTPAQPLPPSPTPPPTPTPCPPGGCAVGGITELPDVSGAP